MWILILTIQFIVIIGAVWQIDYDLNVRIFFYEVKKIVYGEFIDDLEIGSKISNFFGITLEGDQESEEDSRVTEK